MGFVEDKEELIKGSQLVKFECMGNGSGFLAYLSGESYNIWMNKSKIFAMKYLKDHPLYDNLMEAYATRKNSLGTAALDEIMGILKALTDSDYIENNLEDQGQEKILFISHSSKDIEYVTLLVQLLEDMNVREMGIRIVCSSLSGYSIPNNIKIFEYLKEQFKNNIFVILLLTKDYYSSVACLNEMGATWISTDNYQAILTPEFEYENVEGAIDASSICFKLNDKYRLDELKTKIENFAISLSNDNEIWPRKLDEFIEKVNNIYNSEKYKVSRHNIQIENIVPDGDDLKFIFRFVNFENINKRCLFIDIEMFDKKKLRTDLRIADEHLNSIELYGDENKRVFISIPNKDILYSDSFDRYTIKAWNLNYHMIRS